MNGFAATSVHKSRIHAASRWLAMALVVLWACLLLPTQAESAPLLRIGYSRGFLGDVDAKDAQAAFDIFAKEFASLEGFHVERTIYEDGRNIIAAIVRGDLDLGIVTTPDYVRSQKDDSLEIVLTRQRGGTIAHRQTLLIRKDAPMQDLQGLKRARLVAIKSDEVGMIFLNSLLAQRGLPSAEKHFSSIEKRSKSTEAVHALYFGRADLCLVSESFYKTAVTMNRQLGERLQGTGKLAASDRLCGHIQKGL